MARHTELVAPIALITAPLPALAQIGLFRKLLVDLTQR